MHVKIIISQECVEELQNLYEVLSPTPEHIIVDGEPQPNPYTANEMFQLAIVESIHQIVANILGGNNIQVEAVEE